MSKISQARFLGIVLPDILLFGCSNTLTPTNSSFSVTKLHSGTNRDLYSVFFIDENVGFVAGDSLTLLKTTNSGVTWTPVDIPNASLQSDKYFYDIAFFDSSIGILSSALGVFRTTNGGVVWS